MSASDELFKNLRGTTEDILQIGKNGPQVKNNSGAIEARNSDDTALAIVRAAPGVDDSDVVTRKQLEVAIKPIIVRDQADTSGGLPANTGARGVLVVTTAGTGAAIGDLLYDDGSGSGTMEILAATNGQTISVTTALTGGTITFDADSLYTWDADGSSGSVQWVKVGDVGAVTGGVRCIRFAFTNAATTDSVTQVPGDAIVIDCRTVFTTAFSGGANVSVGVDTDADLFQLTTQNNPQAATGKVYSTEQDTDVGGSPKNVRVTVTGGPAAGAGIASVFYCNPNG